MSLRAILYAYVLGGLTFIPLVILGVCFYAVYTSVPVGDPNVEKKEKLEQQSRTVEDESSSEDVPSVAATPTSDVNDLPKTRKGWLTVRRSFEETASDGSYVGLVRGFLDARSKDPKRSRPKGMWYVVLKGKVLYLYEDEGMTECEAAIELGSHDVVIYPEDLLDGELFTRRNAICLKPKLPPPEDVMVSVTKEMLSTRDLADAAPDTGESPKQKQKDKAQELEKRHEEAREEAFDPATPWFIFVRSTVEMEDWYLSLVHASDNPSHSPMLAPLQPIFQPADMLHLVETLDEQPDVIPMRWLNALLGRLFFSYYRTKALESYIIGRLMKKLSKVKRPGFLTDVVVREVSVGNRAPTFSKPMLKELTKEGDASLEVHLAYKGEVRITVDATATINLGSRFKSYTVKLVLAAVLRELEGNLLIKVKRPPSNRIWYSFTQMPRMVLDVEPVVSDRQITWGMILSTIESRLKEVIMESIVLPNMDDIAFFESIPYRHRGGIWADASRGERQTEILKAAAELPEEDRMPAIPASAPVSDVSTPLATDLEPASLPRSRSAPGEASTGSSPESEGMPMPRATTVAGTSTPSSASARRRTWFGGAQNGRAEASSSGINAQDLPDGVERGRSLGAESVMSRRASSTPSTPSQSSESDGQTPRPLGDEEDSAHLAPIPIKRSSSQHSRASSSQETSSAASSLDNASSTGPSESRSKSPAHPSEKTLPTSPTTSFFQTLKSRDKQAISNSAKEAMRKWGVNWGALKKTENAAKADEGSDSEQRREADLHRPRPNYAEVRAAVEQRKGSHAGGRLSPAFEPSDAIAVPGSAEGTPSISSSNGQRSSVEHTSFPSTSPRLGGGAGGLEAQVLPRSVSPALPGSIARARTTSSHGSDAAVPTLPPLDEDEHPAEPIHTQPPPPKTMTIPGIHASHRGEVMSMGYAPPPPPPTEQRKTAAIQSVYRLWKNPGAQQPANASVATSADTDAAASQPQSQPGSKPETQIGFNGRDQDATSAGASSVRAAEPPTPAPALAPAHTSPPLPPRPVPPPLPPRSHSTNALQLASEPPRHPPGLDRESPPATAALQSIVSKDNSKRASLEPPPTPPRRQDMTDVRSNGNVNENASGDEQTSMSTSTSKGSPGSSPALPPEGGAVPAKPRPPALPPRRTQPAA